MLSIKIDIGLVNTMCHTYHKYNLRYELLLKLSREKISIPVISILEKGSKPIKNIDDI